MAFWTPRIVPKKALAGPLDSPRTRVERGARVLDRQRPGWEQQINPKTLNIADGSRCILGQLYGAYGHGKNMLAVNDASFAPVSCGFSLMSGDFKELNEEWLKFLKEREDERTVPA